MRRQAARSARSRCRLRNSTGFQLRNFYDCVRVVIACNGTTTLQRRRRGRRRWRRLNICCSDAVVHSNSICILHKPTYIILIIGCKKNQQPMFHLVDTRALAQGSENNVFHSRANWRIVSLTFKRLCGQISMSTQTRCSIQMSRDNIAQLARASCRNRCSGCIGRGVVVSKRAHVAPGLSRSGHEIKAKQAKS
jgi:hypothetical protein